MKSQCPQTYYQILGGLIQLIQKVLPCSWKMHKFRMYSDQLLNFGFKRILRIHETFLNVPAQNSTSHTIHVALLTQYTFKVAVGRNNAQQPACHWDQTFTVSSFSHIVVFLWLLQNTDSKHRNVHKNRQIEMVLYFGIIVFFCIVQQRGSSVVTLFPR